jgi:hypothetical protein
VQAGTKREYIVPALSRVLPVPRMTLAKPFMSQMKMFPENTVFE